MAPTLTGASDRIHLSAKRLRDATLAGRLQSRPRLDLRNCLGESYLGNFGVMGRLRSQPITVGQAKEPAQTGIGIARSIAPPSYRVSRGGESGRMNAAAIAGCLS